MTTITLKMRDGPGTEKYGGQRGEHRMTELVIPLPKARLPARQSGLGKNLPPADFVTHIQSCVAIFSCDEELVLSPIILPGDSGDCFIQNGQAHIVLWQRLTQCWVLRVQLECYGDDSGAQFIDRTAISEQILFGKSLADSLDHLPEIAEQPGAIAQLLAAMHTHGNKTVLDELGDRAGAPSELLCELPFTLVHTRVASQLTYKGDPVRAAPLTNIEIEALLQQAISNN